MAKVERDKLTQRYIDECAEFLDARLCQRAREDHRLVPQRA